MIYMIVLVLFKIEGSHGRIFKRILRSRESVMDTIQWNMCDRTRIVPFTYELNKIYRIWFHDYISESIGSSPLSHLRTNIVPIPISRKEIDMT